MLLVDLVTQGLVRFFHLREEIATIKFAEWQLEKEEIDKTWIRFSLYTIYFRKYQLRK